jgi:hypothetical protein
MRHRLIRERLIAQKKPLSIPKLAIYPLLLKKNPDYTGFVLYL